MSHSTDPSHIDAPDGAASDLPIAPDDSRGDLHTSVTESQEIRISEVLRARFGDDAVRSVETSADEAEPVEAPVAVLDLWDGETERTVPMHHERLLIGSQSADLVLDDPFVSRWHAQLYEDGDFLLLEDMESENGIYLRIADELVLEDRDELIIGRQRFVFRSSWEASDSDGTATAKEAVSTYGAPVGDTPPVRLVHYLEGGRVAGVYPVGDELTIGHEDTDVICPDDPEMSPVHAEIFGDGESYFLRDLQSETGTFIRIQDAVELVDGDCFIIGQTHIDVTYRP